MVYQIAADGMLGWSHDQFGSTVKTEEIALLCSFVNVLELCSSLLPSYKYQAFFVEFRVHMRTHTCHAKHSPTPTSVFQGVVCVCVCVFISPACASHVPHSHTHHV